MEWNIEYNSCSSLCVLKTKLYDYIRQSYQWLCHLAQFINHLSNFDSVFFVSFCFLVIFSQTNRARGNLPRSGRL